MEEDASRWGLVYCSKYDTFRIYEKATYHPFLGKIVPFS
jgi:hypothetical protein